MGMVLVAAGTLLQLAGTALRVNRDARTSTLATVLAAEKLEHLRSLAWSVDAAELGPSPASALDENTDGYCEFFDGRGAMVATGTSRAGSALVRRWSVQPLPGDAASLVLQVVVLPTAAARNGSQGPTGRYVHLVTIRARRVA